MGVQDHPFVVQMLVSSATEPFWACDESLPSGPAIGSARRTGRRHPGPPPPTQAEGEFMIERLQYRSVLEMIHGTLPISQGALITGSGLS